MAIRLFLWAFHENIIINRVMKVCGIKRGKNMSDELTEAELQRGYGGFLIVALTRIYEAWNEGDVQAALRRALRLALFLPKELKDKIAEDVRTISKDMTSAMNLQGSDFYTTELRRNKRTDQVAQYHLAPFVDKLTDLLDERGYLERPGVKPKYPKEKTVWKR